MAIINTTYFKNEIYLPHAKKGISDSVTDVESKVDSFIDEYEQDCLVKSLGVKLAIEFFSKLDESTPNFIKEGEDSKWDDLLNGKTYTNKDGKSCVWRGIRRERTTLGVVPSADKIYDVSFLAYYVYFYYESNDFITRANAGSGNIKAANMEMMVPNQKVVKAWNKFVAMVQGNEYLYYATLKHTVKDGIFGGWYIDYFNENEHMDITMYRFIEDMNDLAEDTYADFEPKIWQYMNQQGI